MLHWGIRKKIQGIMIITMLPLLAGAIWITVSLVEQSYSNQVAVSETNALDDATALLNFQIRMAMSDAVFLANLPSVRYLAESTGAGFDRSKADSAYEQSYDVSSQALGGFLRSKQIYDQARLLGGDGMEILRVNLSKGQTLEVTAPQLQEKGKRYYFSAAAELKQGEVFVSYVDLNRENGKIEKPYKPVLRFATPLRTPKGALVGVVVLNFFADKMFMDALQGLVKRMPGEWMILDQDGYYLYNTLNPDKLWGAPRDLDTGHSCRKDFGETCLRIQRGDHAILNVDGQTYTAYTGKVVFPENPNRYVSVVHLAPPPGFLAYLYEFGWAMLLIMVMAVLGTVLLGWLSGRLLTGPLTELNQTMQRFSQKDWAVRSTLKGNDEVGQLASVFNRMADRLRSLYGDLESKVEERTKELQDINRKLEQSEARFRAILDNTVDAIITIDDHGLVQSFNHGAEKLFGYQADEVIGQNVKMLQTPDVAENHDDYLSHYRETGQPHIIGNGREERGRRKDGSVFPMYLAVSEVRLDDTLLFTGIIRDVTELREMEDSLRQSQLMYKTLAEAAPVGIFYTDPNGKCTYINGQWGQIAGLSEEQAMGDGWARAIHPEDQARVSDLWASTAENGQPFEADYRFKRPDGKVIWVYGRAISRTDSNGNTVGFLGTVTDITKQKNVEKALLESERFTNTLFEASPIGLALCKMDGTLVRVNQAYADIIGRSIPGALELSYWDITPIKYEPQEKSLLEELHRHGRYGPYEKEYIHRDGSLVPVVLNGVLFEKGEETFIWSTVEDITLRAQTEADNLVLGRILDDSINEIYLFSTDDLHFTHVNRGARENLGYTMEELRNMTPVDIKPEINAEEFDELAKPLLDGSRERIEFSTVHQRKDGSTYPVEVYLQLSHSELKPLFVAIIQDVTETIKTRKEIERLSLVAERTDNYVLISDGTGIIQWVNQAFIRVSGFDADEVLGQKVEEILSREGAKLDFTGRSTGTLNGDGVTKPELVFWTKGGEKHWLATDVQPVFDDEGNQVNTVIVAHDITEAKNTEQVLRRQAQIIDQIHDAVASIGLDGTVKTWNRGAESVFGYTPDDILDRNFSVLHTEENRNRLQELIYEPLLENGRLELELEAEHKSGAVFPTFFSFSVLNAWDNHPTGFIAYMADISERIKAERIIRRAKDAAEEASRTKSEFLANMSHELRTPLNAIIGFSEILLDQVFGDLNEKQTRQTRHILDSGRHLLAVINDILDLSKVESGKMSLELSTINPAGLIESSLVLIKEKTVNHGIALELEMDPELRDLPLAADERKLKQIMFNLLSNAAKFTPDGGKITVSAAQEAQQIKIKVIDSGIGIEAKDQQRIFGEFEQVDSTFARQHQGTGLGLSLTRKLVELHGGEIWVESQGRDQGSTFIFTIPLRSLFDGPAPETAQPEKESPVETSRSPGKGHVLVIDDDPIARELITGYLRDESYEVLTAASGRQGLEMAKAWLPMAITLDIILPDLSGFQVLNRLKQDPDTANIPVVVVSITDDRERSLSLGADEFVQKPVRKEQLYSALPSLTSCGQGSFNKVLVVDDNPADIELIKEILQIRGCEVLSASNGSEGIEIIQREKPDLMILDLKMPETSGWETLEALRSSSEGPHPPVLVYTGASLSAEERLELSGKVQAVVLKGGDKEDLISEINRLTRMAYEGS